MDCSLHNSRFDRRYYEWAYTLLSLLGDWEAYRRLECEFAEIKLTLNTGQSRFGVGREFFNFMSGVAR